MHKRWLGLSSIVMAGMMSVTSVGTGAATVLAAEQGENQVLEEAQSDEAGKDASKEAASEAASEASSEEAADAASSASSEETVSEAATEASSEENEVKEEKNEAANEASSEERKEEASEKVEKPETETEEKKAESENNLVFFGRWNQSENCDGNLKFTSQYQEFCYDLGEAVNTQNVNGIKIKVSNQEKNVCIKLYDADMNEKQANYGCNGNSEYVLVPTYEGTVKYIGVMSMPSEAEDYPYGITIDEVSVDAKEVAPVQNEETLVFEGDNLKFTERWEGGAVEGNILEFDKEWREYFISLGKVIPGDSIKSIKIVTKEATPSVAFKVYGDGKELQAFYGQSQKNSYVIYPSVGENVDEFAIMAMNDQTYPFNVEVEKIEVVVDTTPASEKPEKGVEYDIVDLRDPMTDILGDDFIVGTAISYQEFADNLEMDLVTKHFNGVTLGNELKPDSIIRRDTPIITVNLNGEDLQFPELDFSTPDRYLDFFVDWNNAHPDKKIRIRGHVLVWHGQTPERFFHDDYDTSKPYATPDVMNKRLEYYIKSVAEHYTGEGSKYAGMFYGWDVVNEAVSDGTGTYRTASENSPWWRIYNSPEFIQNAFVYANRYMPSEIALFYNDYNETVTSKIGGICELLRTVKATPGARIDGMGMQAHYQIAANSPSIEQIKNAALEYSKIVDQIQFTELDFKGSANSTDERLPERYKGIYDTIRRLKADGVNVTGMTIWGVVDKHSWLQSNNNAGGGADGSARQYPLLFDDNYKAKNAFWALANAGDLEPEARNITLVQNLDGDFSAGNAYELKDNDASATFVPMWNDNGITVKVSVADASVEDTDCFTVYTDDGTGVKSYTVLRSEATEVEGGYEAVVEAPVDTTALAENRVKFDVAVTNGEKSFAFADTTLKQAESSKYYAETVVKPQLSVKKGTVTVDGDPSDEAWDTAEEFPLTINVGSKVAANAKLLWDEENLYVLADVKDAVLNKDSSQNHEQDSIEVFIDENNEKTTAYQEDDKQYRINYENKHSFNGKKCLEENMASEAVVTEDGYRIEASFKWTDITPSVGSKVGLELQINDADDSGKRIGTLSWADKTGNGWSSTGVFGTIVLAEGEAKPELVTKWGVTYYVKADGTKLTGFQDIEGKTYFFKESNGAMQKSQWITVDSKKFYAKADGTIAKNEIVEKWGVKYIFDESGVLAIGRVSFAGDDYYTNAKGAIQKSQFITLDGKKYYAKADGKFAKNETITKWTHKYTFDENGVLVK